MENSSQNFLDYLKVIYRRKWTFVLPIIIGTVIGVLVSMSLPDHYRSTTLILLEEQQVPEAYVTPTDRTTLGSRLSTLSEQIMSRTRLEKIIADFNLYQAEPEPGTINQAVVFLRGIFYGGHTSGKEAALGRMREDIEVKVIDRGIIRRGSSDGGDAFSISYMGNDPYTTMQVTSTLASLFMEENLKLREQYVEGTSEFLDAELAKAKEALEAQERSLRGFKESNMGSLPEQLDANLRTLDRLQMEQQSANLSLRNLVDRKKILEEQLGIAPTGSTMSPKGAELEALREKLRELRSVYKDNYPDVIIAKNRIKELEEELAGHKEDKEATAPGKGPVFSPELLNLNSQIEALSQREADIREQIRRYERRVEYTPANEQRLIDLNRDYDISLQNYKSLLEKKLNARLAENLEKRQKGERFRVVDPPNLPETPFWPNRRKVAATGTLLGTGVGFALIYLFEYFNPVFRKPEDIEELIGLPVLATIPAFSQKPAEGKS